MFKTFLNSYFGFTREQRRGLLVLACISLLLLGVRLVYPYFLEEPVVEIRYFPPLSVSSSSARVSASTQNLFAFDPNTANINTLTALGLSEKTALALIRFREKGFVFREKTDLRKVYGVSEALYQRLEPFVTLKKTGKTPVEHAEQTSTLKTIQQKPSLELNTADSIALVALPGVGPVYARRITKYRDLLGGFYALEQLKEVYGFSDELYLRLRPQLRVDPERIQRIRVNYDDFKRINKHPYLSYEQTVAICNARRKNPLDSLAFQRLLNNETAFRQVYPYLHFD